MPLYIFTLLTLLMAVVGCAHDRNNYAYAPPYAPAVYPQIQSNAQPVAYAAPIATVPPYSGDVAPPGDVGVVSQPGPCPQGCPQAAEAGFVSPAGGVEYGGQTPPCPQGQ